MNMKTLNSLRLIGGVAIVTLLAASQASAVIAYNFGSGLVGNQQGGPFSLGTVFNVSAPVSIDKLGAFDSGGNGIGGGATGIDVAIYKVTIGGGNVLGSGSLVVPSYKFTGTSESLAPGTSTRVASISPITLGAGTYMVVANHYGAGGSEVDYNPYYPPGSPTGANATSANPAFGVTFGGGYFNANSSLSWGGTLAGGWTYDSYYTGTPSTPRYAAGNFDFTPVPEVGQFAMAGVGLLGLVYVGRYARLRRNMKLA